MSINLGPIVTVARRATQQEAASIARDLADLGAESVAVVPCTTFVHTARCARLPGSALHECTCVPVESVVYEVEVRGTAPCVPCYGLGETVDLATDEMVACPVCGGSGACRPLDPRDGSA